MFTELVEKLSCSVLATQIKTNIHIYFATIHPKKLFNSMWKFFYKIGIEVEGVAKPICAHCKMTLWLYPWAEIEQKLFTPNQFLKKAFYYFVENTYWHKIHIVEIQCSKVSLIPSKTKNQVMWCTFGFVFIANAPYTTIRLFASMENFSCH